MELPYEVKREASQLEQHATRFREKDHLDQAKELIDVPALQSKQFNVQTQAALTLAVIALVERLDKLTITDERDDSRGYLRVQTPNYMP